MTPEGAILPDDLLTRTPKLLGDLGNGETGYIVFTEFIVKDDRRCFVNLKAELRDRNPSCVAVRREEDGRFHVTVPCDTTYVPGKLKASEGELEPVASITIGPESLRSSRSGA